ncbi:MAG: hypothetical protein AB7F22_16510 [Reyranella sp.]|uniref:hypothetical protein n=1 Tax=Reyranella sp. TaxID=1929291 RepID=UPI003D14E8E0
MGADTATANDDAWSAAIAAAVLRRGAMVHIASLVLSAAAIVVGAAARADVAFLIAACIIVALGVVEFWLAARVALDAELLDALAARHADLAGFDGAMQRLHLMPPGKAGRPIGARIRGALRLLKLQAAMLGLQLAVLVVFALWA